MNDILGKMIESIKLPSFIQIIKNCKFFWRDLNQKMKLSILSSQV